MTLAEIKRRAVQRQLLKSEGNVAHCARELGISRQTLYTLAASYGWLSEGRIDPNLVKDGRKGESYWQPAGLRDTASNRERKRRQRARIHSERYGQTDAVAIKLGPTWAEREAIVGGD